jgi:RNA polymerase primary sigma factor
VRYLAAGAPAISIDDRREGRDSAGVDFEAHAARRDDVRVKGRVVVDEIRRLFMCLRPEERQVLIQRFGLDGAGVRTFAEVAATLGVSPERVRQIEQRAFTRIRRTTRGREASALLAS